MTQTAVPSYSPVRSLRGSWQDPLPAGLPFRGNPVLLRQEVTCVVVRLL